MHAVFEPSEGGEAPLPRFSPLLVRGFDLVFDRAKALWLAGVRWRLPEARLPSDRPVLLFGNHVSNWDGFLYHDIQRMLRPRAATYSVMVERELRRRPLFRGLGGLGVDAGSPASVRRALRSARALRARRDDFFFTVFPQGETGSPLKRPLGFRAGLTHFARALAPVTLLPVAVHYELLGALRPHAFVTAGEPVAVDAEPPPLAELEARVTALLDGLQTELAGAGEAFDRTSSGVPARRPV